MPSFASSSEVRDSADGLVLVVRARHVFVAGSPSADVHTIKGRLPDAVDVILESNLVIALTGTVNRAAIDAHRIQRSAIANHLLNYFHMNSEQLGVRPASRIFVDDSDGIAKLTLSPTRPILKPSSGTAVRLSAIELLYVFRTRNSPAPQQSGYSGAQSCWYLFPLFSRAFTTCHCPWASCSASPRHTWDAGLAAAADPFSPHAFLPLVAALDRTVDKFAEYHLVRYAPLPAFKNRELRAAEQALPFDFRAVA
ncbi:hypothetical protein BV20DRAFT_964356 [Pilatotrama ljubarskyi]|nr:hypothetical protein BV20DRAFT_964356 [Pilatotrama ljubarskyi]